MAADGGAHGDLQAHESTYSSFISFFKVGTVACFVIALIVVFIIAR